MTCEQQVNVKSILLLIIKVEPGLDLFWVYLGQQRSSLVMFFSFLFQQYQHRSTRAGTFSPLLKAFNKRVCF